LSQHPRALATLAVFQLRAGCILWHRRASSATSTPYLLGISGPSKEFPVDKRKTRERCCHHIGAPAGAPMRHAVPPFRSSHFGRRD
jgi:hypothetical protein